RSFTIGNGKSIFLVFTVKLIILRIIWLILATLFIMVCIFFMHHIETCPTDFIMIL
ncbi:hypothetical protein LINGRAPRIM_LOCUS2284, partial [Linum grandiflorum]